VSFNEPLRTSYEDHHNITVRQCPAGSMLENCCFTRSFCDSVYVRSVSSRGPAVAPSLIVCLGLKSRRWWWGDEIEVVIQVSGKTRGRVSVPRDAEQRAVVVAAPEDAAVPRFTEGKEVRKVVHVPNRLLNLVVS
jgi:hypothetical protein